MRFQFKFLLGSKISLEIKGAASHEFGNNSVSTPDNSSSVPSSNGEAGYRLESNNGKVGGKHAVN